jgi:hypothetical protein
MSSTKTSDETKGPFSSLGYSHVATRTLHSADFNLPSKAPGPQTIVLLTAEPELLKAVLAVFDALSESVSRDMVKDRISFRDLLLARDGYDNQLAYHFGHPSGENVAEEADPEQSRPQKKSKQVDLKSLVDDAKVAQLLPSDFEVPAKHPKQIAKLLKANPSPAVAAAAYVMLHRSRRAPPGSVLIGPSLIKKGSDISTEVFPSTLRADSILCVVSLTDDTENRLRWLLPDDVLSAKLWPQAAFNTSMISKKCRWQAAWECPSMLLIAITLCSASVAFKKLIQV